LLACLRTLPRQRSGGQTAHSRYGCPPGKLFFGYDIKPVKKDGDAEVDDSKKHFDGQGQTLRKKKGDK